MELLKMKIKDEMEQKKFLEKTVTDIIRQMSIPAHLKGYQYLRCALILCVENNEMVTSIGNLLYPAVAKEFGTTPSRVNTNISRAVEVAWNMGDSYVLRSYFGNMLDKVWGKPSAAEFISTVADALRLRFKTENFNNKF